MNSTRQSTRSNSRVVVRIAQKQIQLGQSFLQKIHQNVNKRLGSKYCTCENYMTISEINRTILDKQCVLKTTLSDIKHDREEQNLQNYYLMQKSAFQLPELTEYYKYYSQKSILFSKEYFTLLYQYYQKRKIIEYNRLKVLLNLSDSDDPSKSSKNNGNIEDSTPPTKQRIRISRNLLSHQDETKKINRYQGCNILNELDLSQFQSIIQSKNSHQQSLLINRLRNNLSKHIGPTKNKYLSIEELDKCFDFQKKDQNFNFINKNIDYYFVLNSKQKDNYKKTKKIFREPTCPNTFEEVKQRDLIRNKRNGKRNNSCQNLTKQFQTKNPYEPTNSKLRRKKNLSMDNINTYTSTPYLADERKENIKSRKLQTKSRDKQQCLKEKQNTLLIRGPEIFMESISDLKNKIKKQKQRLMKTALGGNYTSLKRQKCSYATLIGQKGNCLPLNSVNQRFNKKPYEKLRQKIMNAY